MKNFAFAALLLATVAAPASANIVVNGGFETGDFTGWTQFGNTGYTGVEGAGNGEGPPGEGGPAALGANDAIYEGDYSASFGPVDSVGGIYQSLATTAGGAYTLTFALKNAGGTPNFFSVSFGGAEVESQTNGDQTLGYELHTYNLVATGDSTELRFSFQHNPSYWYLDAVSLDAATDVPEPAMLGLFGLGAIGLGLARRRKA